MMEKVIADPPGSAFFFAFYLAPGKRSIMNFAGISQLIERVRKERPVVHVITNWVTAGDVASGLHAIGARPIMAQSEEELEEVVSQAHAVVLNLGTPDPGRARALFQAGRHARSFRRPVVFDPVGVGVSRFRRKTAQTLLSELEIGVIRGNRAEIGILSGEGGNLMGVDAASGPSDLLGAAQGLSQRTGGVVAVTGPRDLVVRGGQGIFVENGHPMMTQVTGMGCVLSGVIGAFAAVETDHWMATVGAIAFFGLAGERAGLRAVGPGTFKIALFDSLYALSADEVEKGIRLSEV